MRISNLKLVAPLTPMLPDFGINPAAVERQAEVQIARGAQGFYLCGNTGEGMLLTVAERMQLVERWRAVLAPEIPLIVHVGASSPMDAIALARHAEHIGATGVSAVTPSPYAAADAGALVACFSAMANAAPSLPFFYYLNSASPGLKIKGVDFLAAAQEKIPNLGGLKFTSENLSDFSRSLRFAGGRYDVLFGKDEMALGALAMGARGFVGGSYNILCPLLHRITTAWEEGRFEEACKAQELLIDTISVFGRWGGLAALKVATSQLGPDLGPMRLPLKNVPANNVARICADLDAAWPGWKTAGVV